MKEIDARGLACPAPVLQTKAALQEESPAGVRVVVDNAASQQNVQRFLESQGFQTALEQVVRLSGHRNLRFDAFGQPQPAIEAITAMQKDHGHVRHRPHWLRRRRVGPEIDGQFPAHAQGNGHELWRLVFVNNGVKLTIDGSEVLEDLKPMKRTALKSWSAAPA